MIFTLPRCRTFTLGTYNPNAQESDACRGADYGPEHYIVTQAWASLNLCSEECDSHCQRQHKDKEDTPKPPLEIEHGSLRWKAAILLTMPQQLTEQKLMDQNSYFRESQLFPAPTLTTK